MTRWPARRWRPAPASSTWRPARNAAAVIRELREAYPNLPILATGGKTPEVTGATVEAGANALIWAPPSITELQRDMMVRYREREAVEAVSTEDAGAAAGAGTTEAEPAVPPMPDITDMPVADVPAGVVDTAPPEAEAADPGRQALREPLQEPPAAPPLPRPPRPLGALRIHMAPRREALLAGAPFCSLRRPPAGRAANRVRCRADCDRMAARGRPPSIIKAVV